MKKVKQFFKDNYIYFAGTAILTVIFFFINRAVPFALDDLWYSTNLATDGPLTGFKDVIEGQIWHYNNWGGRVVTHGLLQTMLMQGELFCDIANTVMLVLLGIMVTLVSDSKKFSSFFAGVVLIFAFNANICESMIWESGAANYLFSTTWILLFIYPYISALRGRIFKNLPTVIWIVPIGLATGWSNENMGPAAFCFAFMVVAYLLKTQGKSAIRAWMPCGLVTSAIGSALVVLAPGNFVRSSNIDKGGLFKLATDRFIQMLEAGANYLIPSFMALTFALILYLVVLKLKPTVEGVIIVITIVLSFGAMVLSPHYPDRATFGTMVLAIAEILRIKDISVKEKADYKKLFEVILALLFVAAVFRVLCSGGMAYETM